MIGDFPIQFSIYINCPLHHVFLAWEAYGYIRILWSTSVRASLKSGSKLELKKCLSETNLAAVINVWVVCWRAPRENHNNDSGTYRYETNKAYSFQMLLSNVAASMVCLMHLVKRRVTKTIYSTVPLHARGANIAVSRSRGCKFWLDVKILFITPSLHTGLRPQYDRLSKFWCPNETIR